MKNNILCSLDNLVINVENVSQGTFDCFTNKLARLEAFSEIPEIRANIGLGYSEYHYNLNIGQGSGAIRIGYKHNSCKESARAFTMRVEFNPSKQVESNFKAYWDVFKALFKEHMKLIKQIDIAFDLSVTTRQIIATSLTGRQRSMIKDTVYYGTRGNNGRLKIYDKKKEMQQRQKIEVPDDVELTRIEYTWKFEKALTAQKFSKSQPDFKGQYKVAVLDIEKLNGEVKAMVLAFHHGFVKWNEFTRTSKLKIKNALDTMDLLDLDHVYQHASKDIVSQITSYFK